MRTFLTILLGFYFPSLLSFGQTTAVDKESFLAQGLTRTFEEVQFLGRDNLPQDQTCPQGGALIFENLAAKQAGLLSAIDATDDVLDAVKPSVQLKLAENSRCGSCRQMNLVSSLASISPDKTKFSAQCEGRPTETFRLNARDKSEIRNFTEDLLRGRNAEGRRLLAGCPDPCSYYITTAQTKIANATHVNLTVQCGQPRKGSVFSAAYNFKAGVAHQWSCSK